MRFRTLPGIIVCRRGQPRPSLGMAIFVAVRRASNGRRFSTTSGMISHLASQYRRGFVAGSSWGWAMTTADYAAIGVLIVLILWALATQFL